MNKGKAAAGLGSAARQPLRLLVNAVLGGMCGVGFLWTLTAAWPPSRRYVLRFGDHLESWSHDYPTVVLGLLVGVIGALALQAMKKSEG